MPGHSWEASAFLDADSELGFVTVFKIDFYILCESVCGDVRDYRYLWKPEMSGPPPAGVYSWCECPTGVLGLRFLGKRSVCS